MHIILSSHSRVAARGSRCSFVYSVPPTRTGKSCRQQRLDKEKPGWTRHAKSHESSFGLKAYRSGQTWNEDSPWGTPAALPAANVCRRQVVSHHFASLTGRGDARIVQGRSMDRPRSGRPYRFHCCRRRSGRRRSLTAAGCLDTCVAERVI